ncbi:MAG TPA: hypothetical protein P5233_04840 [Candidatus Paceibacterota bacterium]|nr:hypothetical protein [Candidatus Paceibacterota bacterium]
MLTVLFTSDYEIHGNGEGCPRELMVEPTDRMLAQFERYGARLTLMADVAEILKFKEYRDQVGRDDCHYGAIVDQLRGAVRRGHDVQLHLHASYFNSRYEQGRWQQDWSEYNFAALEAERLNQIVRLGKDYLETLLRPVWPAYECFVFRAANWAVSPSQNVVRALVANGIRIDTSVFKYGRRQGRVNFDYTTACSNLKPWRVDERDICREDPDGRLLEVPIYAERRRLGAFLTLQRLYRAVLSWRHRFSDAPAKGSPQPPPARRAGGGPGRLVRLALGWHAWKADFNQCTGRQLIRALERAERSVASTAAGRDVPFVLIGHSKLFTRFNQRSLEPFLEFVAARPERFRFGVFGDVAAAGWCEQGGGQVAERAEGVGHG